MTVTAILTCYNRKDKTIKCIKQLHCNNDVSIRFIVVDDNSSDGTKNEIIELIADGYDIDLIEGGGHLYWAGGMRIGIDYYLSRKAPRTDFVLLVNDDVSFYPNAIDKCVANAKMQNTIVVGNCCDENDRFTYGIIRVNSMFSGKKLFTHPDVRNMVNGGGTFNCNCVLIDDNTFRELGNFDEHYLHSLADYDYGINARKKGKMILGTESFVGVCIDDHGGVNSWLDNTLSRRERIRLKESPKGQPYKEWFYFLNKNFGIVYAIVYSLVPYIKILVKK